MQSTALKNTQGICACRGSYQTHPGSTPGSALTRFPGILDCLVQVFISEASILIFPLIQVLLHGAQGILHSCSCFIGLSSSCFGILDCVLCILCKERNISEVSRSREEAPWITVSARRREQRESVQPAQNKPCSLPSMSCTDCSWVRSCSFFSRRPASLSFAVCRVPLIAAIKEMLFAGAQSSPKDSRSCHKPLSPPLSLLCCLLAPSSRLLLFLFSVLEVAPRFSEMTFCETNMGL